MHHYAGRTTTCGPYELTWNRYEEEIISSNRYIENCCPPASGLDGGRAVVLEWVCRGRRCRPGQSLGLDQSREAFFVL
jgi:hypothetical protein